MISFLLALSLQTGQLQNKAITEVQNGWGSGQAVYRVVDTEAGNVCYVTFPAGHISCLKERQ